MTKFTLSLIRIWKKSAYACTMVSMTIIPYRLGIQSPIYQKITMRDAR